MHRPFLAMALLQHPENPFESAYSHSVLAAQNAASFIIRTSARYLDKVPDLILRFWDMWVYLPNAAVSIHRSISCAVRIWGTNRFLFRLSATLDHRCFDRDPRAKYSIRRRERPGARDQGLGEWHGLLVVRKGGAREWEKPYNPSVFVVSESDRRVYLFFGQPYVRQMSQRANNLAPVAKLSNSPMLSAPSRAEPEEPRSVDGNKNKDDLYLFTRGQVFKKSSQRSSAPLRSSSFPVPNAGISKRPAPSFASCFPDSGYDASPCLTLSSFPGQQDGFPSFSNHGNNHGYHSSSSTPGMPPSMVPPLDLFSLDALDRLSVFGSTTNAATTVDGVDPSGSVSWLQPFGTSDGPSIGFGR